MSDNKFSENMVVCAVGNLSPGNIGDSCESCPHNKFSFPGVLIAGVTKDAVMLLSEKVEIVPEGTKAKVAELEASNAVLLEENGKLRKINKELIGFLEKECRMCMFGGLNGCGACLLNEECGRLDMIKKAKGKQP